MSRHTTKCGTNFAKPPWTVTLINANDSLHSHNMLVTRILLLTQKSSVTTTRVQRLPGWRELVHVGSTDRRNDLVAGLQMVARSRSETSSRRRCTRSCHVTRLAFGTNSTACPFVRHGHRPAGVDVQQGRRLRHSTTPLCWRCWPWFVHCTRLQWDRCHGRWILRRWRHSIHTVASRSVVCHTGDGGWSCGPCLQSSATNSTVKQHHIPLHLLCRLSFHIVLQALVLNVQVSFV